MKTKPSVDVDPEHVFAAATSFHATAILLRHYYRDMSGIAGIPKGERFIIPSRNPMVVNCAFAIELYFKAVLYQQGDNPHGHNPYKLFCALSDDLKEALRSQYAKRPEATVISFMMHLMQNTSQMPEVTLDLALSKSADAYEAHRYMHQATAGADLDFYLSDFVDLLRIELIARNPAWEKLPLTLQTVPIPLNS